MQWAAVTTLFLWIKAPPQKRSPRRPTNENILQTNIRLITNTILANKIYDVVPEKFFLGCVNGLFQFYPYEAWREG